MRDFLYLAAELFMIICIQSLLEVMLYDKKESADVSLIYIIANNSDNKSMEEAKAKIDEAYSQLQAGKNFAEVADNYTDKNIIPAIPAEPCTEHLFYLGMCVGIFGCKFRYFNAAL